MVDSDMPEPNRAETFRECGNCSLRLELPFVCRIDRDMREMRGLVHIPTIKTVAVLSFWTFDNAAV
jgi:hypothetical protein